MLKKLINQVAAKNYLTTKEYKWQNNQSLYCFTLSICEFNILIFTINVMKLLIYAYISLYRCSEVDSALLIS